MFMNDSFRFPNYFPSKKFFDRKIFNLLVGVFFLILLMTRRLCVLPSKIVEVLYNTFVLDVTVVRKLEAVGANHAVGHFYKFLYIR